MPIVWPRLIRFLTWNFFFALLPLFIVWALRALGELPAPDGAYAPEWFFFGLTISATTIGDIADETRVGGSNVPLLVFRNVLLVGTCIAAIFYGANTIYEINDISGGSAFRANITLVAVGLALLLFATSVITQVLIARIQGAPP